MKNKILSAFILLVLFISCNICAQEKSKNKIVYERNVIHVDDPPACASILLVQV